MQLNSSVRQVRAFAPATCANVAVGFDILGFAIRGVGDTVTLTLRDKPGIVISDIVADESLPAEIDKNVATAVIANFCQQQQITAGFEVRIEKGIPLGSGMGGSAASSVAAMVALNEFLQTPCIQHELVEYAVHGETVASGSPHTDNVVPCIFGGLTLTRSLKPLQVAQLPIPDLQCVLVNPHLRVDTRSAREVLPKKMALSSYIAQSRHLAGFMVALYQNDTELLRETLQDELIEPHRAPLVQGFAEVKRAALDAGAINVSLSGSGPSLFAFAQNAQQAELIATAMKAAFAEKNIAADSWVSPIATEAATILTVECDSRLG